jgi:hypothetical protein
MGSTNYTEQEMAMAKQQGRDLDKLFQDAISTG